MNLLRRGICNWLAVVLVMTAVADANGQAAGAVDPRQPSRLPPTLEPARLPPVDAGQQTSPPVRGDNSQPRGSPQNSRQRRSSLGAVQRVNVRVTASSGGNVYLDKGRRAGLLAGDEVSLFPPGGDIVNATIQSVSKSSSRCTVVSGRGPVDIGTRGEVRIPSDRLDPEVEKLPRGNAPEHPPWTRPPEDWDQNEPLLAPAFSQSPRDRAPTIHGRLFAHYMHTWNRHSAHNQYSLGRMGASLRMENPFCRGGGLRLDGEFSRRGVFLDDELDDVSDPGRLNRISYHWGGGDENPFRIEAGRFVSYEFPEAGILDGAELVYKTGRGHRVGVSAGFLPEPFPSLVLIDDLHVGVFCRWVSDDQETASSTVAFQKTWHKGTPDRELLIWSGDYDPSEYLSVHSTVWCDFYDSRDTLKSTRFEITEAVVEPVVQFDPGRAIGAHVSYVRWPQLLRRDFSPFVQQQVVGDHVVRYGLFSWQDLNDCVRLDGRVDRWHDQSNEAGTSWDIGIRFRDLLFEHGEVALSVFGTDGLYSTGPGGRVMVNHRFSRCFASVSYDLADYELARQGARVRLGNTAGVILQQSARANLDITLSPNRSVSVFADYRFGQNQSAVQGGVFYQRRL